MVARGGRVLLVDDNQDERRRNRWILEDAGFDVLEAADAGEAQRLISTCAPQVVLVDLVMPAKSSWELLGSWALEASATPPVIALTWSAAEENELLAKELGAAAYVVKPVPAEDLVRVVRRLLA